MTLEQMMSFSPPEQQEDPFVDKNLPDEKTDTLFRPDERLLHEFNGHIVRHFIDGLGISSDGLSFTPEGRSQLLSRLSASPYSRNNNLIHPAPQIVDLFDKELAKQTPDSLKRNPGGQIEANLKLKDLFNNGQKHLLYSSV